MIKNLFNARSIAVVGASGNKNKVGGIIFRNLLQNYKGKVFPVNPKYDEIEGVRCYGSVKDIKDKVDLVIIAVPSHIAVEVIEDVKEKGIKNVVLVSGGFGEVGNKELEQRLRKQIKEYGLTLIGPNCIGIINNENGIDSVFFPPHRLKRPGKGGVSIITQSGGVGVILLSKAQENGIGINKFISYGNAYGVDESDLLEFLANDKGSEIILLYIEGVRDGKKFMKALAKASSKKPVVVLKAGKESSGKKAALTHTGSLAGEYIAYKAVFRKAKAIEVYSIEDMFNLLSLFTQPLVKNNRVGVITNGGGLGVLCSDEIEKQGLKLAELGEEELNRIREFIPSYATPSNPLDLIADADIERFRRAVDVFMESKRVDMIIVNILIQSPFLNDSIVEHISNRKKPLIVVVPGGGRAKEIREMFNMNDIPAFDDPKEGVFFLKSLYYYSKNHKPIWKRSRK